MATMNLVDEEDATVVVRDTRLMEAEGCRRAICAKAVSLAEGRLITRTSRNSKILEWQGTRVSDDSAGHGQAHRDVVVQCAAA